MMSQRSTQISNIKQYIPLNLAPPAVTLGFRNSIPVVVVTRDLFVLAR